MKLTNAAKRFDKLECANAYNPAETFRAQFDLFDDTKRDGLTAQRRILSVAPDVTIPARKALAIDGDYWVIGGVNKDFFGTEAIRHKYTMQLANGLAAVKTMAQALQAAAGLSAYASRTWVKASKEIEISSEMTNVYDIMFAEAEPVTEDQLINLDGHWHLVREVYESPAGFLIALSDQLEEPSITTMDFVARTYQPTTDDYADVTTTVPALRIRWQSHFRYLQRSVVKFKSGDIVAVVLQSDVAAPKSGDRVTIAGEDYQVATVSDEGAVWALHLNNA